MHLERLERAIGWDAIVTADHDAERAKPRPTLYLEALEQLGVVGRRRRSRSRTRRTARSARSAAGIYVVGIPNAVTRDLDLAGTADLVRGLARRPAAGRAARTLPLGDSRTAAVASAPATIDDPERCLQEIGARAGSDARERASTTSERPCANVSVTTSAARIAGATIDKQLRRRAAAAACSPRQRGRPPSAPPCPRRPRAP